MTTAQEVTDAWAEIANLYDPTEGDPDAALLVRNASEHDATIAGALAHIGMVASAEGELLGPMGYEFCLERRLWRRGLEAVLQARALQQVFCWAARFPADREALRAIVVRHTFDPSFRFATPLLRQHRSIHFVVMPFVYQEVLLLSAASLVELYGRASDANPWEFLDVPRSDLAGEPPRAFRKFVARLLTSDAFDPNSAGENPIGALSRSSAWFAGIDDDAPEPSDVQTVLAYSAQDFALAHEIGHRLSMESGGDGPYLQSEMAADLAGFRLFAASWGWRDEVLEGCPLTPGARLLIGPIWFFFTAGLLFGMRKGLLARVEAVLDCDAGFIDAAQDDEHVSALASRWQEVRLNLNAYGDEVRKLGGGFCEQDIARLTNLVAVLEEFSRHLEGWLLAMPDESLLEAVCLVRPEAALKVPP